MKADATTTEGKMELMHFSTTVAAGPNRQIIATTRGHEIIMDIPKKLGGDDTGPTPPECLALALGGCLINICRIMAAEKQIELQDLRLSIAGDIDPSRALGLDTSTRAGFSQLSVEVEVEFASELSESEKGKFYQELLGRCPLCDTISNPTPLQIRFS
jgi:putative redox protein